MKTRCCWSQPWTWWPVREAEHALRDAAIAAGILDRARDNAGRTLRALLLSLGFRAVEVRFQLE